MTRDKYLYISLEKAIEIHEYIVSADDGLAGIKNQGQLESVLESIQNDSYYPEVFDKVTHLVFGIIKFHVFNDGNKRTALALGAYFLGLNYSNDLADKFIVAMEDVVVDVAAGKIEKDLLKEIITAIFMESEQDEDLLFKIYKAIKK